MTEVNSPVRVRTVLDELKLHPAKRLGQNFLCDPNWIQKAAESVPPNLPVVEIGPGLGALTASILNHGREVWAVEIDSRLCRHLRKQFAGLPLHLLEADAVAEPLAGFAGIHREFALLSNLPFAITSPWLDSLLRPGNTLPSFMGLILQKEGIDRLLAKPRDKAYGPTAIRVTLSYIHQGSRTVPRSAFYPQPSIESRFGTWTLREEPRLFSSESVALLRRFFGQRRKMMRHGMNQWLFTPEQDRWNRLLASHGLAPTARAEEIDPDLWWELIGTKAFPTSRSGNSQRTSNSDP